MFTVKDKRCPCDCDENGALAYLACPSCRKVVLVCDEIGNVFDNLEHPLDSLPLVIWRKTGQFCPQCSKVLLADFEAASEADLVAHGVNLTTVEVAEKLVQLSINHHKL